VVVSAARHPPSPAFERLAGTFAKRIALVIPK
jgi:hypothetical protein